MTRRLLLGPEVPDDLRSIRAYLEQYSFDTADRFIANAFAAFQDLVEAPGKGSPKYFRSRRLAGIRSWWVPHFRKYLILYEITETAIIIHAVTHGARNLRALLRERIP